jgi:hypothetical protein
VGVGQPGQVVPPADAVLGPAGGREVAVLELDEGAAVAGGEPDLVPINAYATREALAAAVESFGSQARSVVLLSALHLREGRIVRIRQVHDTAAMRA